MTLEKENMISHSSHEPDWLREDEETALVNPRSSAPDGRPSWLREVGNDRSDNFQSSQKIRKSDVPTQSSKDRNWRKYDGGESSLISSPQRGDRKSSDNSNQGCDCIAVWFHTFHVIAGVSAVSCAAANAIDVFYRTDGLRGAVLHAYATIFSLIVVAMELEIPFVVNRLKILDLWIPRGLFYIFVGCLTVDQSDDGDSVDLHFWQNVGGVVLLGISLLYIIQGLLCMQSLRNHRLQGSDANSYSTV